MKPVIALTVGDHNGIGPEVVLKCLRSRAVRRVCTPLLVGPAQVFRVQARKLGISVKFKPMTFDDVPKAIGKPAARSVLVVEPPDAGIVLSTPGQVSSDAGRIAARAIETAVRLTLNNRAHALVTAPVSKQALHGAGVVFPGQTEMIQHLCGASHVAMMLVSPTLRVGLVTIHIPISQVAATITQELIVEKVGTINGALMRDWNIRRPVIAVLGLNPHAGEGGDIGSEERDILIPALDRLRAQGIRIQGPFPADGFFARYRPGTFDAVIAMYHDQGLIPLKMLGSGSAVNVSVGLAIVRTSPGHGTAFDIAGRGMADPSGMVEAVTLAATIAVNRRKRTRRTS